MFGRKKGPTRPFVHAYDCKIMKADPTTEIPWSEVETGHWQSANAGSNTFTKRPPTVVLGSTPLTRPPFTTAGQCKHRDTTDPTLFAAILKVRDGAGGDYW